MVDTKLSDLSPLTTPAVTDIVYVVQDPSGTPVDRSVVIGNMPTNWKTPQAFNNQTGATYILALADNGKVVELDRATAVTVTVPPNVDVAFLVGERIDLIQMGAGQVTVAAGAGVTIRSFGGLKLAGRYAGASLIQRSADVWYLLGALVS